MVHQCCRESCQCGVDTQAYKWAVRLSLVGSKVSWSQNCKVVLHKLCAVVVVVYVCKCRWYVGLLQRRRRQLFASRTTVMRSRGGHMYSSAFFQRRRRQLSASRAAVIQSRIQQRCCQQSCCWVLWQNGCLPLQHRRCLLSASRAAVIRSRGLRWKR